MNFIIARLRTSSLAVTTTKSWSSRIATASSYPAIRQYHHGREAQYAYKDNQDRATLKPKSTEATKSGTDEEVAHTDVAFDPKKTRPETQKKEAGKEAKKVNPLDASPANQDLSKPQGDHGKEG